MNNGEKMGIMVARALGLGLIVTGLTPLLYLIPWFQPAGMASSGWTSYSPPATPPSQDLVSQLHDTFYVISSAASFYVPSLAEALVGVAVIFLCHPIGRWLGRGLSDKESETTK